MAIEQVIPTEQDRQNETIWELWLWADDNLKPGCKPHELIRKLAEKIIEELREETEDQYDEG